MRKGRGRKVGKAGNKPTFGRRPKLSIVSDLGSSKRRLSGKAGHPMRLKKTSSTMSAHKR